MPTYAKVMVITDLVLCSLRGMLVVFSMVGYYALRQQGSPLMRSVPWEIITGLGIALCGIPGNALVLARQRWAVFLCYLAVLFGLGSVAVGLWQLALTIDPLPPGSPERTGAMIGGGVMTIIRVAIAAMYVAGLMMVTGSARRTAF